MLSVFRRLYLKLNAYKKQRYLNNLIKNGLKIGKNVRIIDQFFFDPSHCFLISIGDGCTICPNVRLIAHDASTFQFLGYTKLGRIEIGKNCFIGDSAIILPNVKIGDDCIIGAGSIVTRDIPSNSVAARNPARVICDLESYLKRIHELQSRKKVFDEQYFIHNLDPEKRQEVIKSVGDSIGFIV